MFDLEKKARELKKASEDISDKTTDSVMRTAGQMKGQFTYPETKTKSGFFGGEKTWFLCSSCGSKLGPIKDRDWKKALKRTFSGAQVIVGAVTVNPILIAGGSVGLATGKRREKSFMEELRQDSKNQEDARQFMLQCEYCGKWFCSTCWNKEKNVCEPCSRKGLEGLLGL